jgi:uncharacterized SAM-binding protein YcdF (DUF218 family)
MSFALSKILWGLIRPSTFCLFLSIAGLFLTWSRRFVRSGRRLLVIGLVCLAALMLLPVGNWLLLPLEERIPRIAHLPDRVDGIIVLSGALDTALSEERGLPSLNGAAERMTEFVGLARRYPDARLVFTGGSGSLLPGELPEADIARTMVSELGIAPDRVLFENRSRNTYENAFFTRELVRPQPGQTWILITSAAHMPRSVGIFRALDWPVIPWPVGYKTGRSFAVWYDASVGQRIDAADFAVHEWVGMVAYWLMGRIDAIFPSADAQSPAPTS